MPKWPRVNPWLPFIISASALAGASQADRWEFVRQHAHEAPGWALAAIGAGTVAYLVWATVLGGLDLVYKHDPEPWAVGLPAVAAIICGAVVAVGAPVTDIYGVPLVHESHVAALEIVGMGACMLVATFWLSYKMDLRYGVPR